MKYVILTVLLLMSGCTYKQYDAKFYRDIPLYKISIGVDKNKVLEKLGQPYNVIGSKKYKEGTVEVWEYRKYHESVNKSYDPISEQYWLYFWHNRLQQWGRPGDWEKQADRIWKIRVNNNGYI